MYLPVIEPIDRICREAIERGVAGDISGARQRIDRVRTMRAWLARSVISHRTESIEDWIKSSGIDDSEVHHYRSQIAQLSASLEMIRTWLSSSVSTFLHEELVSSPEGLSLYLDSLLPEIWDFSQDVVVLHGQYRKSFYEDLKQRGQKKFVVIVTSDEGGADQVLEQLPSDQVCEHADAVNIVSFPTGSSPRTDIFSELLGQEIPCVVLIGAESDSAMENDFQRIFKSLSALFLGKKSVKEWPRVFTEQWLSRIPQLAQHQSVSALRPVFGGRDVLIASPGPSLYESLDDLKINRGRFLVIAPIRSLLTLFKHDIVPDFAFHVDATDFSKIIPKHPMLSRVVLICTDYAHPSVFEAGFGSIYTVTDPAMVENAISEVFHGKSVPVLQGGCVATCAVVFAAQFAARSITLVGQDLSFSGGRYVEQAGGASSADLYVSMQNPEYELGDSEDDNPDDFLTCEGINGERLRTKEDYHWFIGEMENAARMFSHDIDFVNSTAHGAKLKGWLHKTLDAHPLLLEESASNQSPQLDSGAMSDEAREIRRVALLQAVQLEKADAENAAGLCAALVSECRSLIASRSNNVSELESLEAQLQPLLRKQGSILHFYTSRFSMALAAASKSVENLEENLNISAEYYHHIGPRAKKLASMLEDAAEKLELHLSTGVVENGQ